MNGFVPSELEGWDEIIELAGRDNTPSRGQAKAKAAQKQVLAMVNLGNSMLSMQKVIGTRLESLTNQIKKANDASDRISRRTFWLTIVLVIATIAQAVAALITIKVASGK